MTIKENNPDKNVKGTSEQELQEPKGLSRRELVGDLGPKAILAAALGGLLFKSTSAKAQTTDTAPAGSNESLVGVIEDVPEDYSPVTGLGRTAVPSACWQCVTRDAIIAYVEDGRLAHIEGNPRLKRTNGKLCARGHGGVGQVYDPDRLLYPMKRVAGTARGAHQWQRITWDAALAELTTKLSEIRAQDPGKFMFHYGRMKASSSKLIKDYFLYGYGTKSYAGHTAICEGAKWTAQELVWGKHYDVNDVENSKFILNFGANPIEAHTNHIPFYQRLMTAIKDRGVELHTFDVRLSNTANKSTAWHPIVPGTDLAVLLAMTHHIITSNLAPQQGIDFINTWSNIDATGFADRVAKLRDVLSNPGQYVTEQVTADPETPAYWNAADQPAGGYTPEWAEGISGVPAATIRELAQKYAQNSPGSTIITYRGAVQHFNGVNTERAAMTLEGLCGNIDTQGGRVHAVSAKWKYDATYPKPSSSGLSSINYENKGNYVAPTHGASHQVLEGIAAAPPEERPGLYLIYCYTPAYANGDMQRNIDILKNEALLPYIVTCDTSYSEAAMYADLILPDTTYLERWDWEDMVSANMIPEYYIRQPVVTPLGEVRDFKDVCIDLANRLAANADDPLTLLANVGSTQNYVMAACNDTEVVNAAGVAAGYANGFEFMKAEGAWWDPASVPKYQAYAAAANLAPVDPETIADDDETEYIFEDAEGICWETTKADFLVGYRATKSSYKHYKGQKIGAAYYAGFKPDKANKSGMFELDSVIMKAKHYPGLPIWMKVPEHDGLAGDELILSSFKVSTQVHSRTQNCKYLTEITHDNPAWLNPTTAAALGIVDGDMITLTRTKELFNDAALATSMGTTNASMTLKVLVTPAIHPKAIAISHHLGHWAYGRYASGQSHPLVASDADSAAHATGDADANSIWWTGTGYRGNWIIPNTGDPIGGGHRGFDTVVRVQKA